MRKVEKNKTDSLWNKRKDGLAYFCYGKRRINELKKAGKGTVVEPTKYMFGNGVMFTYKLGRIVGWGRNGYSVRVLCPPQVTVSTYWCGFWQPSSEQL